jgi:acetoacetyl-CoA reductase
MRIALITGGTKGLGAAIAMAFKDAGYKVVVNDIVAAPEFTERTAIPVFTWDVSNFDESAKGVAQVEAAVGPIDVLVNNAGITRDSMLHKMTAAAWNSVIGTDLSGCFNMCRNVIEGMRERRFGRIINISSVNGLSGQAGQTNYAAAKAGMIGFTKSLALETASRGITVNAVAPGYADTEMVANVRADVLEQILKGVPVGRLALPTEIARAVLFLAADDAGFITGQTLNVNGGKYMQ